MKELECICIIMLNHWMITIIAFKTIKTISNVNNYNAINYINNLLEKI